MINFASSTQNYLTFGSTEKTEQESRSTSEPRGTLGYFKELLSTPSSAGTVKVKLSTRTEPGQKFDKKA